VANKFAFAYAPNASVQSYDIYSNSTVAASGAKQLTNQGFAFVFSIQYTPDGTKIVFVAQTQAFVSNLYVMNSDGSNLLIVDNADDAYVGPDNVSLCYTKEDGNLNGQIWTSTITGGNMKQITTDNWDHYGCQYSKDLSHIAWAAAPTLSYDIYSSKADGTGGVQLTNVAPDNAVTPAWSGDGSKLAYVYESASNTALDGIYTVTSGGTNPLQIVANQLVNSGVNWTNSSGFFASRGKGSAFIGTSYHVIRLRRRGIHIR
jgi:Tol biopolymer transport system component